MTLFFDQLRGIIPAIYKENKKADPKGGQIHKQIKGFFVKLDGRFTRWLSWHFFKKFPPEGSWLKEKNEYIWRRRRNL